MMIQYRRLLSVFTVLVLTISMVGSGSAKGPPPGKGPGSGGGGNDTSDPVPDPKVKQEAPIQAGTSGGWANDLANGYCCGGTLGGLVEDANGQYLLSNFHVLASDRTPGGNGITANIGAPVIQPGLIDVACNANNAQVVGTLEGYADPLGGANVDAAIAKVVNGMVDTSGAILGIGTLSSQTVAASIRQRVKKMGRTSGLTSSRIDGLNATIHVSYEDECAGQARGTATFTGQIVVANKGGKFLTSGDSGSVMVENVDANPRAVGLLYAGSGKSAIANPIGEVLNVFGVTMVGTGGAGAAAASSPADMSAASEAQAAHARLFESVPNAVGHAISQNAAGKTILKVYVEKNAAAAKDALPSRAGGFPVVVEAIGKVVAF